MRKGFTLVEVLVAVSIMAILMGVAVVNLSGAFRRGFLTQAQACGMAILNAQEVYYMDKGTYAASAANLKSSLLTPCSISGMSYTITRATNADFSAQITYNPRPGVNISLTVDRKGVH